MDVASLVDIVLNSLVSWLFIPVNSEINWFSQRAFHNGNAMLWPTLAAMLGSLLGILGSYLLGWVAALDVKNMPLPEEKYQKAARIAQRFLVWCLLIPWWPFYAFFALIFGFLRVSFWRILALVIISRWVYYGYYLYI